MTITVTEEAFEARYHHQTRCFKRSLSVLLLAVAVVAYQVVDGQQVTLRATSRLVNVSVVVQDSRGTPVRGLGKDDFVLLDDGRPQRIRFFGEVANEQARSRQALPPDTYTNVLPPDTPPNVTVIVFDVLSARWAAQGFALNKVRQFLRGIQPEDHVGLYVIGGDPLGEPGGELRVLHDFVTDASDLAVAIARYDTERIRKSTQPAAPGTGLPELDDFLSGKDIRYHFDLEEHCPSPARAQMLRERSQAIFLAVVSAIVQHMAAAPGRKSIIWISDRLPEAMLARNIEAVAEQPAHATPRLPVGHPDDPECPLAALRQNQAVGLERMVRLLNDNGVAFYPVSAEGLQAARPDFNSHTAAEVQGPTRIPPPVGSPSTHRTMRELAERTGGRAFYDRNDLGLALRRDLDDARVSYALGYYPDHGRWNGEFRRIELKVNRPGLRILVRQGYFALPEPQPLASGARKEAIERMAASPLDASEFPFRVHLATAAREGTEFLDAQLSFNPQPALTREAGRWCGNVEAVFLELDAKNVVLKTVTKAMALDMTSSADAEAARTGIEIPAQLALQPNAAVLSVILRDTNSGWAGSVRIPLARYVAQQGSH